MGPDLMTLATQFGVAGLIAWMWLTERRAATAREQQLSRAHEELMQKNVQLDALLTAIGENTRAIASLEAGQRSLHALLERMSGSRGDGGRFNGT